MAWKIETISVRKGGVKRDANKYYSEEEVEKAKKKAFKKGKKFKKKSLLKQKIKSRRVLKRGNTTLVLKEREPAPYVPIFFKR